MPDPAKVLRLTRLPNAAGALLVVLVSGVWDGAGVLLRSRCVQLPGTISFSCYLTHEPIVVTTRFLLQGHPHGPVPVLSLRILIAVGWLFHRAVERLCPLLAKRVGRPAPSRVEGRHAAPATT